MTKNNILQIQLPDKLKFLLSEKHRYKVAYGGRASGKSYSMILASLARAMEKKVRILCVRQFQNSIADSVHKLIADTIYRLKLDKFFTVTQSSIRCINGSEFIFKGIHNNVQEIKSLEGIDIAVCEEAQNVPDDSWEPIDNTTECEVEAWLEIVARIRPQRVMVYTIDRDTPLDTLEKISVEELRRIAARVEALGIECSVAG